jgi:hypothetical protein
MLGIFHTPNEEEVEKTASRKEAEVTFNVDT